MPAAVRAMSRPHVTVCPLVSYYTKSGYFSVVRSSRWKTHTEKEEEYSTL
jgi:hypothetical protein